MFTRKQRIIVLSLVVLAAAFRIAIVHYLPNDSTDDSLGYEQIARNLLEHHVYSHVAEPPYTPTLVRLPGYPLFLAAIYSVFGHTNNTAVRVVQALIDTGTCLLVALLAWLWQPDERRKNSTAIAALALAAVNPFTTIYAATILTEVPATFLLVAAAVAGTLAFREANLERELRWWAIGGALISLGVLFRPDLGLAAGAIGVTLVVTRFFSAKTESDPERRRRSLQPAHSIFSRIVLPGAAFSLAFLLVLAPWTIRNWRTLHVFQPLAPLNANTPGEFIPLGYEHWLKTWMTDGDYLDDMLWDLDKNQIDVDELPDSAFDSQAEHDRVSDLFDQYNGPEDEPASDNEAARPASSPPPPSSSPAQSANKTQPARNSGDENSEDTDEADQENQTNKEPKMGAMTPEIDAAFGQIANERIARHPFRYYVLLPLRRAHSLWFNTHSDYYPFTGNALPLNNPDNSPSQNFWLPVFAALVAIYTVLGVGGFVWLAMNAGADGRLWVVLVALIFATRLALFSMAVSVEPRYVVEFFPFLFAAGGLAFVRFTERFRRTKDA